MEKLDAKKLTEMAKKLFEEEGQINHLEGWFFIRKKSLELEEKYKNYSLVTKTALILNEVCKELPIFISQNAIFAGTQRDAFARSYALINPNFKVSTFNGYCDPTAVFNDIEPSDAFPQSEIDRVRDLTAETPYVKDLKSVYEKAETYTAEVAYFIEQVTGHLIPDFRKILASGVNSFLKVIEEKYLAEKDPVKKDNYFAFKTALNCVKILAERYAEIAKSQGQNFIAENCLATFDRGAENLAEAMQLFILLWQVMCIEQAPNPFAFSVGNSDRIFEPYRAKTNMSREEAAALFKHFLVFFNVGDRSWAISQNLIVGGKSNNGKDLTSLMTYAILDAYYDMNLPQPILSTKLHSGTPKELYESLGRFFFTPGVLTPSIFNDDSMFKVLSEKGVDKQDLEDYSIAGCQEPLIMGKDNGNTTNSWLNMPKILEITLGNGKSLLTGKEIIPANNLTNLEILKNIRELFAENLQFFVDKMVESANGASEAISNLPVPFLSCFMGGIESGYEMRDTKHQGTKYNGSGCLIHGLSVVSDSFVAIDRLLAERPQDCDNLIDALKKNFQGYDELREFMLAAPKYGNNNDIADSAATELAEMVCDLVNSRKNYLGNAFRADLSSPSTHLLYGYWVAATPDGRKAQEMLNYGIDPLYGESINGLGYRILSNFKLPFIKFCGGYASHIGVDPKYFDGKTFEEKGLQFEERVIDPVFFNPENKNEISPYYLYFNVTTAETLRKVLADPKKYAPSGVYIMRIHGTFVNFLDLSPDIQEDIIKRLDIQQ